MPSNDNDPSALGLRLPDAHGHAALLLVESLIHGLLARSMVTTQDAINIVESADSIQVEVAEAAEGAAEPMWRSHALLAAIANSLRADLRGSSAIARPAPKDDG